MEITVTKIQLFNIIGGIKRIKWYYNSKYFAIKRNTTKYIRDC